MHFFKRNHAYYYRVAFLCPLYRYAITATVLAALWAGWLLSIHALLESRMSQCQSRMYQLRDQESMIMQSQKDIVRLEASIISTQSQLDAIKKSVYSSNQSTMMAIINQAGLCGLIMRSCAAVDQKKEQVCTRNIVMVDVSGTFEQLLHFVQSLAKDNSLIAIEHATITHFHTQEAHALFNLKCNLEILDIVG